MEHTIDIFGMTIHYLDSAPDPAEAGGRRVLVFLHGWGASKETFAPVISALQDRYRVIAPDLPGFGKTGELDRPWSIQDYGSFIEAFLEALGLTEQPLTVCGHSHGGRILIKWAATRPAKGLRSMVLIDSAGLRRRRGAGWYAKVYAYKAGKKLTEAPGLGKILSPFAEGWLARAGSADYREASPVMRQTMNLQLEEDLGYCLPMIKAPTLLFWGEQDTDTPLSQGRQMERGIPDAGLVVLSPAGHYAYLDQLPAFVRALTYFIENA
ncbi:MAG: alpha/beta hydrolase [Clostridiales bacterium]|nr:alpha/beta hydrolase [Clostridiales bacterium]